MTCGSLRMSNLVDTGSWSPPRVSTTGHRHSLRRAGRGQESECGLQTSVHQKSLP